MARTDEFRERYRRALEAYISGSAGDAELIDPMTLGRDALNEGCGLVEVLSIHQLVMPAVIAEFTRTTVFPQIAAAIAKAQEFLTELAAPYEMTHRGWRQAVDQMRRLNESLERQVTERTAALRDSERRFQDIAEVSGDWMWETDREHRFTVVFGEHTVGVSIGGEPLTGRTRWEAADADPATDEVWARHKAELDARQPFRHFRYQIHFPDGVRLFVSASGKPVFDQDGTFLGYRGTATDETAMVEARRRAEEAEATTRRIFETSQDLILVTDRQGTLIRVSPSSMSVLGYDPDEMVGRGGAEFLYPEDLDNTRNEMRAARRGGMTQNFECRYVHKQGRIVTLWWKGVWLHSAQQHFFVGRDITDRRENDRRLRDSEERLKQAQRLAQMGSYLSDVRTGAVEWSDETYRVCGVSRDTFVPSGPNILAMIHPDDRAQVLASMAQRRQGITPAPFEYRLIRPDGTVRHIYGESEIIKDEDGNPRYVAGVIQDITRLKEARKALADREEQLSRAQRLARMGSDLRDLRSGEREWSDETYRIFGVNRDTFAATLENVFNMIHPEDQPIVVANRAKTADGMCPAPFEYRIVRPDGKVRHVYREWELIYDDAGHAVQLLGTIQDITERRQTEQQLRQAQKMEAIGNLTGGLAHDFNNILGVIVGNLGLARNRLGTDQELQEIVGEALEAAWRGAELTRSLLAFARRQPLRPALIDVNELVSNTLRLLRRLLGEDIEVALTLTENIWPVTADPAQLESALANLANNARDAMPRGGHLIIATANRRLDADYAAQHGDVTPGDYAMIEVSDTGAGMSAEIMGQIFEPFFTTKELGKGTGLGLSMVFGFLRQSGGHVNVYSEPGKGTTFRLYLPRETTEAAVSELTEAASGAGSAGETILVVEDNQAMRRVVVRQLRDLGYRVLECDRAAAALEVLHGELVDLLFTDIVMPGGLDGVELARLARERWPSLKIILTSGFPEARLNASGQLLDNLRLLSKPYSNDELTAALRAALDG